MAVTRPMSRLKYTETEVHRLRTDVDEWKESHDLLTGDCWVWEDLVAKANHVFVKIIDFDEDVRDSVMNRGLSYDPELNAAIHKLLRDWNSTALQILPQVERLEKDYRSFDGSDEFRRHLTEAKDILTPDHVFFSADQLASMRDQAIEEDRTGLTEPFHVDGFA